MVGPCALCTAANLTLLQRYCLHACYGHLRFISYLYYQYDPVPDQHSFTYTYIYVGVYLQKAEFNINGHTFNKYIEYVNFII